MPSPENTSPAVVDARRLAIGAALVAASALLFSTKAVVVKCAYPYGVDALTLLTLRMGLALPCFLVVAWRETTRAAQPLSRGDLARCVGLGVLGYYAASFLDFEGLRFIGVGLERMVLYLYPTVVVAAGAAFMGQRPTRLAVAALALTYLGIGLTYVGQDIGGSRIALGAALVAGSAVSYALFVLWSGAAMKRLGSQRFMAVAMSGACLAMLTHFACGTLVDGGTAILRQPAAVYGYGALLAIAGTVAPALLMGEGLKRVGAQRFALISTIGPVGTVLLGWLVLDERVGVLNTLGMVLTIVAGAAMGLAKPAPAKASDAAR